MAIQHPEWTFDKSYYALNNKNSAFEIQTDPVKGKGLFSLKSFDEGDVVLMERALGAAQNVDERFTPVCDHCLLSLESPSEIVSRVSKGKLTAEFNKLAEPYKPTKPTIVYCPACDEVPYCSQTCKDEGFKLHHAALCSSTMSAKGKKALEQFIEYPWQQGGVDYTDTHNLALRLVARGVSQSRTGSVKSLTEAFQPIAQLIKAPIDRFHFPFLLRPDSVDAAKAWHDFLTHRNRPEYAPDVVAAETAEGNMTKQEMVSKGYQWMVAALGLTAEESAIVTPLMWSELLGAVLLNGQERTPNSPYTLFMRKVRETDNNFLRDFHAKIKEKGYDPKDFRQSTKGQAIYPIGCLFNHSCEPNLEILYDDELNNETLVAVCKTPIKAGDELCISYIDEDLDFRARQQQLEEHYLFRCGCPKCAKEASLWPKK